jgi:hypothetical protein
MKECKVLFFNEPDGSHPRTDYSDGPWLCEEITQKLNTYIKDGWNVASCTCGNKFFGLIVILEK